MVGALGQARRDVGDVSILRSAALLEQRCAEVFMSRRVANGVASLLGLIRGQLGL